MSANGQPLSPSTLQHHGMECGQWPLSWLLVSNIIIQIRERCHSIDFYRLFDVYYFSAYVFILDSHAGTVLRLLLIVRRSRVCCACVSSYIDRTRLENAEEYERNKQKFNVQTRDIFGGEKTNKKCSRKKREGAQRSIDEGNEKNDAS